MMCPSRRALYCIALSSVMAAGVRADPSSGACDAHAGRLKVVRQADGGEMIRLAALDAVQAPDPSSQNISPQVQRLVPWPDEVQEARLVTALATLPGVQRSEGQTLPDIVDPAMVRSWAEFVDPTLALKWKYAQLGGFTGAMLQRQDDGGKGQHYGNRRAAGKPASAEPGKKTTWRNVVVEGAKRSRSGQQALREWRMLPMPEPKSNPWLSNLGSYRY